MPTNSVSATSPWLRLCSMATSDAKHAADPRDDLRRAEDEHRADDRSDEPDPADAAEPGQRARAHHRDDGHRRQDRQHVDLERVGAGGEGAAGPGWADRDDEHKGEQYFP